MSTDNEFSDAQIMGAITVALADRNVEMAVALMRVLAEQISRERSDLSADIESQVSRLLAPRKLDEAHPVCPDCAQGRDTFTKVRVVDETCHVCRVSTDSGLYVRAGAA